MDVYLVRHGRTQLNAAGLLRGRLDPPLDMVGLAEARDLASQLGEVGVSRVVSSPLLRAMETAGPIAAAAEVSVEIDERFIDRDYGVFNGRSCSDVAPGFGSLDDAPGIEPAAEVAARAEPALAELVAGTDPGPLVIVTHDAVIRLLIDQVLPASEHHEHVPQRTGCWNLLHYTDSGWKLVIVDSKDDPVDPAFAH
jgi:broad specificity phosphatase PhoE